MNDQELRKIAKILDKILKKHCQIENLQNKIRKLRSDIKNLRKYEQHVIKNQRKAQKMCEAKLNLIDLIISKNIFTEKKRKHWA